jgi:phosphate:Na+ symporter
LHALDHASRLTEVANGGIDFGSPDGGQEDIRARELCIEAMRSAAAIAREVAAPPSESPEVMPVSDDSAIAELERCATQLVEMRRTHRAATLGAVANGTLSADAALVRVESVRSLEALSLHAWRSAAHLVGRG